ncbi:S41 family peptidase [Chromobacterium paludis]|uniref:Tail specific protease domain-containing protein n=1 Tax=Chromobacterium paludis TaxID=2605945 RepID=A0A5C1DKC9_9NEIS|nr:S41 family peptidase [Chromobacterium paludis]QEL56527.1 hypothetical protein FYK34_13635 [Chromobacterium paludis]
MILGLLGAALASAGWAQGEDWQALAREQLAFAHQTLVDAHPGAIDSENPGFRRWLEQGYAEALRLTREVRSQEQVLGPLQYYLVGFQDVHVVLSASPKMRFYRWQGWTAKPQGDRWLVDAVAKDWPTALPPQGAQWLSCDGKPAEAALRQDVMPYLDRREPLEGQRWELGRYAAMQSAQLRALSPLPASCRFRLADGSEKDYAMSARRFDRSPLPPPASFKPEIRDLGEGRYWVQVADFMPQGERIQQMQNVIAGMQALRSAKLIVLDTRGNRGGSSQYATDLLESLYGKDDAAWLERRADGDSYIEWRVSAASERYPQVALAYPGLPAATRVWAEKLQKRLTQARKEGREWLREDDSDAVKAPATFAGKPRIAWITRSDCASSCLMFADLVKQIPGSVQLGQMTNADTTYMDVTSEPLPSGLGVLHLPMKVIRHRPRASNQPYLPDAHYDGDIDDTKALQAWVLQRMG